LPLDFSEEGLRFARFSVPTKASEYLISGTPVMVFAPRETAISKFCSENDCGLCVTEMNEKHISDALHLLIRDDKYRERITDNAVRIAKTLFDADKVRSEFQQLLINLCRHSIKKAD
jgi:glycosyltransferase involved in cell wall biosynthesis